MSVVHTTFMDNALRAQQHRALILTLAAKAAVDPRTAARAIERGPKGIRGLAGARCADAMALLGIEPENGTSEAAE